MRGKLTTTKNLLAGMPADVRERLAREIRELPIPDAEAIHGDVVRAIEELKKEEKPRRNSSMKSRLFS